MNANKLSISIAEASEVTGISRSMLYKLMNAGDLPFVKIGDRRLIMVDQLKQYLTAAESTEVAR